MEAGKVCCFRQLHKNAIHTPLLIVLFSCIRSARSCSILERFSTSELVKRLYGTGIISPCCSKSVHFSIVPFKHQASKYRVTVSPFWPSEELKKVFSKFVVMSHNGIIFIYLKITSWNKIPKTQTYQHDILRDFAIHCYLNRYIFKS